MEPQAPDTSVIMDGGTPLLAKALSTATTLVAPPSGPVMHEPTRLAHMRLAAAKT
jgi:hypothetical protein